MKGPPLFSVVMPLCNKEREVSRGIASVLSQRLGDLELIVVNDGSIDGSRSAAEAIRDRRLRVLDQPNAGVSAARNSGIAHATAGCIAFLDADDEWLPEFLERIARLMRRHPEAAVFATGFLVDMGTGRAHTARVSGLPRGFEGVVPAYFRTKGLLSSSSVAVRREALDAVGPFREGVSFGEDVDMWLRLASMFRVAFDAHPSAIWHCGASNRACEREPGSSAEALRASLQQIERDPAVPAHVKREARGHVARIGLAEVERLLARGQTDTARRLLRNWRHTFSADSRYVALRLVCGLPPVLLGLLARAGVRAKTMARR